MKLSIIIPAYNCESSIVRCLNSIIDPYENEYEVIVVNDGSTDNTQLFLNEFSTKYDFIKVFEIKNSGVSRARNFGIKKAKGKFISFVDSDDYVNKDYVKILIKEIESNKDVYFFKANILNNSLHNSNIHWIGNLYDITIKDVHNKILLGGSNVPWDKVFKKKIIDNYDIRFRENISLGEDWIFSMDFFDRCKSFQSISSELYFYCIQDGSLSKKKMTEKMLEDQFILIERLLLFGENNLDSKKIALQLLTNSCSKMYKAGFSKNRIYFLLKKNEWFNEIIYSNYPDFKSKLRSFLLVHHNLNLVSIVFTK